MAVFEEQTNLYEILIRVNPDKSWAAHYQTLTEVKKDGVTISASVNDVAPLTEDNIEAYAIVVSLLGELATNTMLENKQLKEQVESLNQELEDLKNSAVQVEA